MSASLLSNDLTTVEKWGNDKLIAFNQRKTTQAVILRKKRPNFSIMLMNGDVLDTPTSFKQLGPSVSSNFTWKLTSIPLLNMLLNLILSVNGAA